MVTMISIWRDRFRPCVLIGIGLPASTALYLIVFPGLRAPYLLVVLLLAGLGLMMKPSRLFFVWRHLRRVMACVRNRSAIMFEGAP